LTVHHSPRQITMASKQKACKRSYVANGSSYHIVVSVGNEDVSKLKSIRFGAAASLAGVQAHVEVERFDSAASKAASKQAREAQSGTCVAIGEYTELVGKGKFAVIKICGLKLDQPDADDFRCVPIVPGKAIIVTKDNSTPYSVPLGDAWEKNLWISDCEPHGNHKPMRFYVMNHSRTTLLVSCHNDVDDQWSEERVCPDPNPAAFVRFTGTHVRIFAHRRRGGKYEEVYNKKACPRTLLRIDAHFHVIQSPQITGKKVDFNLVDSLVST